MRLITFVKEANDRLGMITPQGVVDLLQASDILGSEDRQAAEKNSFFHDIGAFLSGGDQATNLALRLLGQRGLVYLPLESLQLRPPVPNPAKILCIIANSKLRTEGAKFPIPAFPMFFSKFPHCLVEPGGAVLLPKISQKVENEIELAVVIGKSGKYIQRAQAMDHVAGYTIINDISFRDLGKVPALDSTMEPLKDWMKNKSLDRSAPMGPWLVLKDEISDPHCLRLTLKVNGEVLQDGNTQDMLYGIPEIIEFASKGITLEVGDVIATGTCSRVGAHKFLKNGDEIEAEIEGIGVLRHSAAVE